MGSWVANPEYVHFRAFVSISSSDFKQQNRSLENYLFTISNTLERYLYSKHYLLQAVKILTAVTDYVSSPYSDLNTSYWENLIYLQSYSSHITKKGFMLFKDFLWPKIWFYFLESTITTGNILLQIYFYQLLQWTQRQVVYKEMC